MINSKAWDWKSADKSRWLTPSEDCVYLSYKWKKEGVKTILDLGCGLGRHTLYFAENGFQVSAVDLSEDAVHATQSLQKENHVQFSCLTADMMSLPFPENSFDAVFSYRVISHQDTPGVKAVIGEITRVLKPEGRLFVTLCAKEHFAFTCPEYRHIDENTVLKTEGAEVDVPHFFADRNIIAELFKDYRMVSLRHITECEPDNAKRERCHYHIEAIKRRTD